MISFFSEKPPAVADQHMVRNFRATSDYKTDDAVQISFSEGAIISVIEEDQDGQLHA